MSETPDIAKIAAEVARQVATQAVVDAKQVASTTLASSSDHDLLISVHEKVKALTMSVDKLNDNMDARLQRVETSKLSASDFISFRNEEVILNDDKEKRIRFLERYVWIGIALIGVVEPVLIALFIKKII